MSLWLIANTVARDAAEIRVTNSSDTPVSAAEAAGIDVVRGGPRSLQWKQANSTAGRRIAYVDKRSRLSARFCVIADAKAQDGRFIDVIAAASYPSSQAAVVNNVEIDGPFIGVSMADKVFDFGEQLDMEAFIYHLRGGVAEANTVRQVYFGLGLEFARKDGGVQFDRVPVWSPAVAHGGHYYKLHAYGRFTVGPMTRDDVDAYNDLPKHDPVFFYDDTGDAGYGNYLPHKLWHCIILSADVEVQYSDNVGELLFINFEVGLLKGGNG